MSLLELFCDVDDFWKAFQPEWQAQLLQSGTKKRKRNGRLSMSEVMTIMIHFHQSGYRHFKGYYQQYVQQHLQSAFPDLVSYSRFVELQAGALMPLIVYLSQQLGQQTGIAFVDATPLRVCRNQRIPQHKVFAGLAKRGKTSMGWFYGFKLHLIVNDQGEILTFFLTPGNVDDRKPLPKMVAWLNLVGRLFADKGYISKALVQQFLTKDLHLITPIRKDMKNRLLPLLDKLLLRKRAIIESVNDQLKNISQIEHSRHRSPTNFLVNLLSGLIAYTLQPKKPSLNLDRSLLSQLQVAI